MTNVIWRAVFGGFAILATLTSCSPSQPIFHPTDNPARLSEWNLFDISGGSFAPVPAAMVFSPANPLFTDYAQKLRTLWLPAGTSAQWQDGEIIYPVGSILTKTFYYPVDSNGEAVKSEIINLSSIDLNEHRLVETRLLVRRAEGWDAFPYIWNDEQTEAFLRVAGGSAQINLKSDSGEQRFNYFVPNENQCEGCHVTAHPNGELQPLAATWQQLQTPLANAASATTATQIEEMQARGWLNNAPAATPTIAWTDTSATLNDRAIAYLKVHCGHCHNPQGAADTSALILDGSSTMPVNIGVCKEPVAAGGGAGDRLYAIVPGAPEQSIFIYRMESTAPDEMMPELGRSLVHSEGVELIRQWIAGTPGRCQPFTTDQ